MKIASSFFISPDKIRELNDNNHHNLRVEATEKSMTYYLDGREWFSVEMLSHDSLSETKKEGGE